MLREYHVSTCVPSDFLTRGEVEEDRSVHDVDLVGLSGRDTAYRIINVFKFYERLSHAWHHRQVTTCKKSMGFQTFITGDNSPFQTTHRT